MDTNTPIESIEKAMERSKLLELLMAMQPMMPMFGGGVPGEEQATMMPGEQMAQQGMMPEEQMAQQGVMPGEQVPPELLAQMSQMSPQAMIGEGQIPPGLLAQMSQMPPQAMMGEGQIPPELLAQTPQLSPQAGAPEEQIPPELLAQMSQEIPEEQYMAPQETTSMQTAPLDLEQLLSSSGMPINVTINTQGGPVKVGQVAANSDQFPNLNLMGLSAGSNTSGINNVLSDLNQVNDRITQMKLAGYIQLGFLDELNKRINNGD